ncbi:MAG: DUF169 domain-containing protein [Methanocalculus sp.]|uniref:DUF169 domain-containing protein n=1 Tax=Methanocalculus sp. TaxID=2004547 RepID=UPI00271E94F8|nr:DUF169 domain-containing protein [Methanocalculus sp.]MDO9540153.1 DUF169 domain-containing protein [Methanocalculus sp.]
MTKQIDEIRNTGRAMKEILNLRGSPVGVRLLKTDTPIPGAVPADGHRYCQALMRARHGEHVVVTAETIACPAAARAFGFKPLPEPLRTGKGLVGFGITSDDAVGMKMFEGMTVLEMGAIQQIDLFPLDKTTEVPDIIVVEDETEKLMWIALSSMHVHGGERIRGSTAVLQATCVDSTIIPYVEKRLNYGLGCYGCRDATDMASGEAILGFPAADLPAITEHLKHLANKALPHSRGKHAYAALTKKNVEEESSCSEL